MGGREKEYKDISAIITDKMLLTDYLTKTKKTVNNRMVGYCGGTLLGG